MSPLLCYLIPLFIIAVALDANFITGLQRFRKLKKRINRQRWNFENQ